MDSMKPHDNPKTQMHDLYPPDSMPKMELRRRLKNWRDGGGGSRSVDLVVPFVVLFGGAPSVVEKKRQLRVVRAHRARDPEWLAPLFSLDILRCHQRRCTCPS